MASVQHGRVSQMTANSAQGNVYMETLTCVGLTLVGLHPDVKRDLKTVSNDFSDHP